MKTTLLLTGAMLSLISISTAMSQTPNPSLWNGKPCAVVLTYDDGLNVHLDNVVPALNARGLKGTFYLPGNSQCLYNRMEEWRAVACGGHELGNHTLFHPCIGQSMGRAWVSPDQDMDSYTVNRMVSEIRVANTLLRGIDGRTQRSFAYTCGDKTVRDTSFVPLIKDLFVASRGVTSKMESIDSIDLCDVGAIMINGQTGPQLIDMVKEAQKNGKLLVFLFHGVGGEHGLNVGLEAHTQLLDYLKANESTIWIAPFCEVTAFVAERSAQK